MVNIPLEIRATCPGCNSAMSVRILETIDEINTIAVSVKCQDRFCVIRNKRYIMLIKFDEIASDNPNVLSSDVIEVN